MILKLSDLTGFHESCFKIFDVRIYMNAYYNGRNSKYIHAVICEKSGLFICDCETNNFTKKNYYGTKAELVKRERIGEIIKSNNIANEYAIDLETQQLIKL